MLATMPAALPTEPRQPQEIAVRIVPYNKLVRDHIPAIISATAGRTAVTRILSPDEFIAALKVKLLEETQEVVSASTPEALTLELGDVLELLHTLAAASNIPMDAVEAIRQERATSRGAFTTGTLLIETHEPDTV